MNPPKKHPRFQRNLSKVGSRPTTPSGQLTFLLLALRNFVQVVIGARADRLGGNAAEAVVAPLRSHRETVADYWSILLVATPSVSVQCAAAADSPRRCLHLSVRLNLSLSVRLQTR